MKNKLTRLTLPATLITLLSLVLLVFIFTDTAHAAEGDTYTGGNFTFTELSNGTLSITGYSGSGGTVTLPSEFDPGSGAMTVSAIGDMAFYYKSTITKVIIPSSIKYIGSSAFQSTGLTEIIIPDTVTEISDYAFTFCKSLTSVSFGSGLSAVPDGIFRGCSELTYLEIPEGYTAINQWALSDCDKLSTVVLPSTLKSIDYNSFTGCDSLISITLPSGLETLGFGAFQNTGLTMILIPDNVSSIGQAAFYNCTSLSYVKLPSSLSTIEQSTFKQCSSLETITLPNSIDSIGTWAFHESGLTEITLPANITSTGSYVFQNCTALETVTLPDGLLTIDPSAFSGCISLGSITIPGSVNTIDDSAFAGCTALSEVNLSEGISVIDYKVFYGCSSLTSITIPGSVDTIYFNAFQNCTSLINFTIPDSVTAIYSDSFAGCTSLTEITIPASVSSLGQRVFSGCASLARAYILPNNIYLISDCFVNTNLASDGIYAFSNAYYAKNYATNNSIPFHYLYPISFNTLGGTAVESQVVADNEQMQKPADPTKDGNIFEGWFGDSGYTQPITFPYTPTEAKTLYAKWYSAVTSVTLDRTSLSMIHHDTALLSAAVLPADATYPEITWTSSDENVATVSSSGLVQAVGVGTADITAAADGISDICTVTVVKKAVTGITLSDSALNMLHNDTYHLTAQVLPSDATYPQVTWFSSDESIATVSSAGVVTAENIGTATITATADGFTDTCDISVLKKPVSFVTMVFNSLYITHHDNQTLSAFVTPGDASYPQITWSSNNESVATVDSSGVVTAVGIGSANITATADGKSSTLTFTVIKKAVTNVALSQSSLNMIHHDSTTLTAQVSPNDATYSEVTWTSSDESVATVSSDGAVQAVGVGEATIIATADGISDSCSVTVSKNAVTGVAMSKETLHMIHHDIYTLTAGISPSNATYQDISWNSSDESVATVNDSGTVEALSVGEATITASVDGMSDKCIVTVTKKAVSLVELNAVNLSMIHHDSFSLTSTIYPVNATYPSVTWSTSNENIATISPDGTITAVGIGTATITATADGISAACSVAVVKKPVTDLTLNSNYMTLIHHEAAELIASVLPNNATYPEVTWISSDESVVLINQQGIITAIGLGDATITATADGVFDRCDITVVKNPVASIALSETALEMQHHDTYMLSANVMPGNATYPDVTWSSSDESVLTVSSDGAIEAKGLGTAVVTASADGKSSSCEISVVKKPVNAITLSTNEKTIAVGELLALTATVNPEEATFSEVTWIDSNGTATAVGDTILVTPPSSGRYTITATADGVSSTCVITAIQPVTSVVLSSSYKTITHHDSIKLSASVLPSDATYPDVIWKSSNPSVASVSDEGIVTAIKPGSATVTAVADGITSKCEVKVTKKAVENIAFDKTSLSLVHHDTSQLTVQVLPSNATYQEVIWSTNNENIVSVNPSGTIEAVGTGEAIVTATADGITSFCNVYVSKLPVASVTLSSYEELLHVGDTFTLSSTVLPENATYPDVIWSSSDETVAVVSSNGLVTIIATGEAVITATADNVKSSCVLSVSAVAIKAESLEKNEAAGTITMIIDVNDLPSGTSAIMTSDGQTIELNGTTLIELTVDSYELSQANDIVIIAIDDDNIALGAFSVHIETVNSNVPSSESENNKNLIPIIKTLLIVSSVIGVIGLLSYLFIKFKMKANRKH